MLTVSYFFVYIIRGAISDWAQFFLEEVKNYPRPIACTCSTWFELGGVFGGLFSGWMSDRIFKGKRIPVTVIFSSLVTLSLIAVWFSPSLISHPTISSYAIASVIGFPLFGVIGFFIFGPQMLIGMAAAELSSKKAAGSATGFVGLFAYLGAAMAGFPTGWLIGKFGWEAFFIGMVFCGILSVLVLLPIWKARARLMEESELDSV